MKTVEEWDAAKAAVHAEVYSKSVLSPSEAEKLAEVAVTALYGPRPLPPKPIVLEITPVELKLLDTILTQAHYDGTTVYRKIANAKDKLDA